MRVIRGCTTALAALLWVMPAANAAERCGSGPLPPYVSAAADALTPEKGAALRAAVRQVPKPDCKVMRTLHDELSAVLTAPSFDRSAYLAKTQKLQQLRDRRMSDLAAAFADQLAKLSPEERKAVDAGIRNGRHKRRVHAEGQGAPAAAAAH